MDDLEWLGAAACADLDPDVPFGRPGGQRVDPALEAACARCTVRPECLEYALSRPVEHGYIAGTTPAERRALLQERAG